MRVTSFPLGPIETNSYILDDGKNALSIDVGGDPAPILDFLSRENLTLLATIITHQHFDHLYGVHALQEKLGTPCYCPKGDAPIENTESTKGGRWGLPRVPEFRKEYLPDGEDTIGPFHFKILPTPGHTPGGVSFYFPDAKSVFTGDSLFYRSMGRTDFPFGDHEKLIKGIRDNLFTLPPDTTVYPGHGPQSNIGEESLENPFIGEGSAR